MHASRLERARLALDGLSVGDAFGERFFGPPEKVTPRIEQRLLPADPWFWTDDTAMALSVVDELEANHAIDADSLARRFARRYREDSRRGYGGTAHDVLMDISLGNPWREVAQSAFDGQGSMGNGAAMRSPPVGAYFADDLAAVVEHARASAAPTHAHPEGQAGAIAVAVAAALASPKAAGPLPVSGSTLLRETLALTPAGPTREGIALAVSLPFGISPAEAATSLGNGSGVISSDTVPFSLWCAARHLTSFEEALWATVSALGDRDTTCAIVGGIVALSAGRSSIPPHFLNAREPLDSALSYLDRHEISVRLGRA
jgi:ADP-ribosylglycohydrolase